MTLEIDLDSNTAIQLAIECYLFETKQTDKEELIMNIAEMFRNREKRKLWIVKHLNLDVVLGEND